MNIDSINSGIVIDHIQAGNSMNIYGLLGLDKLQSSVAIIKNCKSRKMGRKDIIKIDGEFDVNLDVLGYVDPGATVSIIKDGVTAQKKKLSLPRRIVNVVRCNNPRCITTTETALDQVFVLADDPPRQNCGFVGDPGTRGLYRCVYCDAAKG
ncbi:MAG: aspartate carbamoyltransferase regulatory subunit [Oscillospiraceae bacterium]|jgi:aspartate carbamoyltransferase regulatory subunit|nr:aspartate carbamoyltransferase regulatory subunit [Oscillospiraceae bacterium]